MGLSYQNHVVLVCDKEEAEWFFALPEANRSGFARMLPASHSNTECPVAVIAYSDEIDVLYLSTNNNGVIDWTTS